jgi:hypothetical protein
MTKLFLTIFILFILYLTTNGQTYNDSVTIKKYEADTLDFIPFPNAKLLDSIKPKKGFKKWEINTATSLTTFYNVYRFPKPKKIVPNTTVLSKCLKGFGTFCPPSGCAWYISAQRRKSIFTIEDLAGLSSFLGNIDNKFNAYLWLVSHDLSSSRFVPIETSTSTTYKIVEDGFLISIRIRISDCPVTQGLVTYFVGYDKRVIHIRSKVTSVGEGCI